MSLAFVCGSAFAQESPEVQKTSTAPTEKEWKVKGFEPQVRVFADEGLDKQQNLSLGADFVAAYRFNEIIRLGGGVGVSYVDLRFQEPTTGTVTSKAYDEDAMAIPVFVNLKVDFLKKKVSPFFAVDGGYNFFIPFSKYAKDNKLGFFIRPSLGVDIRFSKCVLSIDIAYRYQARTFENFLATYGGYNQICQSVAVSF